MSRHGDLASPRQGYARRNGAVMTKSHAATSAPGKTRLELGPFPADLPAMTCAARTTTAPHSDRPGTRRQGRRVRT
jgi:hypothetical protein